MYGMAIRCIRVSGAATLGLVLSRQDSGNSMTVPSCPASEASPTEASPAFRVQERSFFVRMKSTLTKRGLNVKASGYKVGVPARPRGAGG